MLSLIRDNPIRKVEKLKAMQAEQMRVLKTELQKELEMEIVSVENFLKSDNINATDEEIDIHLSAIRETYNLAINR